MTIVLVPDTISILRLISPTYDTLGNTGQLGRIAVIGGCHEDASAAYFAAISALKLGAALSYVFCTKDAGPIIQSYSPDLMVKPVLFESYSLRDEEKESVLAQVIEQVVTWMKNFDCLVIGPGLGGDQFLLDCVGEIMKKARQSNIPMVVDGEGLDIVRKDIDIIQDYPLVVLSLDTIDYKQFVLTVLGTDLNDQDVLQQFVSLSTELGGVTILLKGKSDYISDGIQVYQLNDVGCARNPSQAGFALSGSIAVFIAWARQRAAKGPLPMSQTILGCIAASTVFRRAGAFAFRNKKRSTLTSDIIENLGPSLEELCPLQIPDRKRTYSMRERGMEKNADRKPCFYNFFLTLISSYLF